MKKFRQRLFEFKEGFLDGKFQCMSVAFWFTTTGIIFCTYFLIAYASLIFVLFGLDFMFYIILAIDATLMVIFTSNSKAFDMIWKYGVKATQYFFGRYGRVVTKQDWKRIKKDSIQGSFF